MNLNNYKLETIIDILQDSGYNVTQEQVNRALNTIEWMNISKKDINQTLLEILTKDLNTKRFTELEEKFDKLAIFPEEWQEIQNKVFEKVKENPTETAKHIIGDLNMFHNQFIKSLIPTVELDISEEILEEAKKIVLWDFPLAEKKLEHLYNTNKQQQELKKEISQKYTNLLLNTFKQLMLNQHKNNASSEEKILENYKKYIAAVYNEKEKHYSWILLLIIEKIAEEEHNKKAKQQSAMQSAPISNKDKNTRTTLPQTQEKADDKILKIKENITKVINSFKNIKEEKEELIRYIVRIYKNWKPLKEADFFGDFPQKIAILEEDKEKFLDLVESLGIKREENPIENSQIKIGNDIIENSISSVKHEEEKNIDAEIENENLDNESIISVLEKLYEIKDKEGFIKDLNTYREKKKNQCSSVLKKMKREDLMQQIISKGNGIFVIELGWEERIVLEKWDTKLKIIKFLYNHTQYDSFLDAQKW